MKEMEYPLAEVSKKVRNPKWTTWRKKVERMTVEQLVKALGDNSKAENVRRAALAQACAGHAAPADVAAKSSEELRQLLRASRVDEAAVNSIEHKALQEAYVTHDQSLGTGRRESPPKYVTAKNTDLRRSVADPLLWNRDPSRAEAVQEAKTDVPAVRRLLKAARDKYDAHAPWPVSATDPVTVDIADAVQAALVCLGWAV